MEALHNVMNRKNAKGDFVLGPLPYTDDYLEPFIGERTIRYHYWGHLKAYIEAVNRLKTSSPQESLTIEELIKCNEPFDNAIYRNASQVYNHYLYFAQLNSRGNKRPMARTLRLIEGTFGSFDKMKASIAEAAMSIFGSGWVFLVAHNDNTLEIVTHTGTGTPRNCTILIALDMWEHAYYLDYHNHKAKYIEQFFAAIDWSVVERRCDFLGF